MRFISGVIFIVILFLGATFAVLNSQLVSINYYLGTNKLPLSLLVVIVLGAGALIGWLTGLFLWLKLKGENLRLSHRLKAAEKELTELRTLPLKHVP